MSTNNKGITTETLSHSMSLIFYITYPLQVAGKMESIPVDFVCKAGYILDRLSNHHRATNEKCAKASKRCSSYKPYLLYVDTAFKLLVNISNFSFSSESSNCKIPQSSILGPVLFTL